jgi:hypothetical protein
VAIFGRRTNEATERFCDLGIKRPGQPIEYTILPLRKLSRGLAPVVSEKLLRLKPAGCRVAEAAFEVCQ